MSKLTIKNGDWILIGDGKKALLLHNEGDAEYLNLRRLSVHVHDSDRTAQQGTDKPGRSFSSTTPHRSSHETTDWHELDEAKFAKEMADTINRALYEHQFKRLIIVAPPKILGELRHELSSDVHKAIIAELHKDLTKHSLPDIEKILSSYEV